MRPVFSNEMIRELDEVVAEAAARLEVISVQRTAEEIRVRNVSDNVALEDVMEQLIWRAAKMGVPMEFSSDDVVTTSPPLDAMRD